MSTFGDWLDDLNPLTDWVDRARDELAAAAREGMPRSRVLTLQAQLDDAQRRDDQAAAQDVYNVTAQWRSAQGNRGSAPGDGRATTTADVVKAVGDKAQDAAAAAAEAVRTSATATQRAAKATVKGTVDAVAGGASEALGDALPWWVPLALGGAGLVVALGAIAAILRAMPRAPGGTTP